MKTKTKSKRNIKAKKAKSSNVPMIALPFYDMGGWHNISGGEPLDSMSSAGIAVTNELALKVAAVYACVKVIAETISSLPLFVYKRLAKGGKEVAKDHYLYDLLHNQPNTWQTSFQWREMICNWLCLRGNSYNKIFYNARREPVELYPLRADRVTPEWVSDRVIRYKVQLKDGKSEYVSQADMLHVSNTSLDGLTGLSPIAIGAETIGTAIAIRKFGAKAFTSGGSKRLALEHPKLLSKEAYQRLREQWESNYAGSDNQAKTAVLEEGLKASVIGMSLEDAQRIEAEQFSVEDICRYYRMPPHKIQHLLRATYSNIEEQSIEFGTDTILPWCRRIESAINRDLVYDDDIFVEFELSGLLRGNAQARSAFYTALFNIGALSINEIRDKENMNGIGELGDKRYIPMNMQELGKEPEQPEQIMPTETDEEENEEEPEQEENPDKESLQIFIEDAATRIANSYQREKAKLSDKSEEKINNFILQQRNYADKVLLPIKMAWTMSGGKLGESSINAMNFDDREHKDKWIKAIKESLQ